MTISVSIALGIDDIGLTGGRTYRVGDNGIVISGNQIASFDDDGVVFQVLEYEPAPGGWGRVDPHHVHDNNDGTMNVYFRLTGSGLPLYHRDVFVTLDAETGNRIGDIQDLPLGMGRTTSGHADGPMLNAALSLSDGTIAVLRYAGDVVIYNPDGTEVAVSAVVLSGNVGNFDSTLLFDMTQVGDTIAVTWANNYGGGTPAHLRLINLDGSYASDEIALGSADAVAFGATPAARVEALSDGRMVAVWVENGSATGPDTDQTSSWFSILNADGSQAVGPTLINTEVTAAREDMPIVIATESGFQIGYSVLDFAGTQEGRIKEYDNMGNLLDTQNRAYLWGVDDIVRTDNNTAFIVGGNIYELTLPGADTPLDPERPDPDVSRTGSAEADLLEGGNGGDTLNGLAGNDTLHGNDGADRLIGGAGDDFIFGGATAADLRDVVYGGDGNDSINGGYGNDELRGDAGNDSIEGGFGVDTVIGGAGDDVLTGSAWSDLIFGGDGNDFVNGGFGFDRVNGGAGADRFFHVGVAGHGSDWIQDYNAAEGDRLFYGGGEGPATADDFLVQIANTANAGDAGVDEVFVTHVPSGNLLWALVDGGGQASINLQIGSQVFDLLA